MAKEMVYGEGGISVAKIPSPSLSIDLYCM